MDKLERSSIGLASFLFEELDDLKAGKSTPQMARSKAAVANTICTITRLEMDHARFVSSARADETDKSALAGIPMGRLAQDNVAATT